MSKLLSLKEGTALGSIYTNRSVSIRVGGASEVPDNVADSLMDRFPGCFESASGAEQESDSDNEEESSNEDSSDPDGVSSDVKSRILSILENSSDPMKITGIADELSVSWQSIRSDIQSLVNVGAVDKSDENLYSV